VADEPLPDYAREQFLGMMRFMGCTCEPTWHEIESETAPPGALCIHHDDRCRMIRLQARRWN
jgi:hypothetical protein